ncbi:YceI family protein [Limibaculum sp. FT325]|uniref:YceI family protein n=1 Tax=Thermohalobaculum sediminis TaxID=2939436 RepID=UPI0020BF30A9|nr:YceI family protein [Limibaculum sediminis]MCL5778468.1 YceI family protein [Limibaculum sediminis]
MAAAASGPTVSVPPLAARIARRPAAAVFLLLAVSLAGRATAQDLPEWVIDPGASEVAFDFVLDGKPDGGVFRAFSGSGEFDAAHPEAATLAISIDTASVDLGNAIVNAFATSAEGFDSANHPEAVYRLTGLEPTGGDGYLARGVVTIKGRQQALETPITLGIGPNAARAEGRFEVDRTRFGLGVGPFSSLIDLEPMVGVHFVLNARRVR